MSGFKARWGPEEVNKVKRKLSKFSRDSQRLRDLMTFPQARTSLLKNLAEPSSWAGNMEIALAAEYFNVCLYVFQHLSNNRWLITSFLPANRMEQCEQSGAFDAEQISQSYLCEDACGEVGPIYILHYNDNHYEPLERMEALSSHQTQQYIHMRPENRRASELKYRASYGNIVPQQQRKEIDPKKKSERRSEVRQIRQGSSTRSSELKNELKQDLKLAHKLARERRDVDLARLYRSLIREVNTFLGNLDAKGHWR